MQDTILASGRETVYDVCGILLGLGCLLTWIGILHFLNFFSTFYVSTCQLGIHFIK